MSIIPIRKIKSNYLARKISMSSSLCLNSSPGQRRNRFAFENVVQKNRGRNRGLNISQYSLSLLKFTSSFYSSKIYLGLLSMPYRPPSRVKKRVSERVLRRAMSLAKSLTESLGESLGQTLGETFSKTLGETFCARQRLPRVSDRIICTTLCKTLFETFFLRGFARANDRKQFPIRMNLAVSLFECYYTEGTNFGSRLCYLTSITEPHEYRKGKIKNCDQYCDGTALFRGRFWCTDTPRWLLAIHRKQNVVRLSIKTRPDQPTFMISSSFLLALQVLSSDKLPLQRVVPATTVATHARLFL